MSFDSLSYLYFLPIVWLLYLLLNLRWQNLFLVLSSYLFYGSWDPRFLFLIVVSTVVDYCCGLLIGNGYIRRKQYSIAAGSLITGLVLFLFVPAWITNGSMLPSGYVWIGMTVVTIVFFAPIMARLLGSLEVHARKRLFLYVSIFSNLGILGTFKYFDFFVTSAETLARTLGATNVELLHLNIILPVGISFYTFQTLSYTIGVYRGELKPTSDFIGFSLFVAFFPQLVAGPIERASHLLPALLSQRQVTSEWIRGGVFLIMLGLFKKVGISNGLAGSVDSIYNSTTGASSLDVAVATVFFALQIYCDFSGYSDIARGSAKLFGIRLMRNFEQPYFSRNPSEFWRRWHISLSSWLRDYLYISMGGNRRGNIKTYRNLMLTMLLGGLWHGAAWNFILWGGYQGALLGAHRFLTGGRPTQVNFFLSSFYIGMFFLFTCYGWLLFRATSLDQIIALTNTLTNFSFSLSIKQPTFSAILGMPILLIIDIFAAKSGRSNPWSDLPNWLRGVFYGSLMFVFLMGLSNSPTQFIYFQF